MFKKLFSVCIVLSLFCVAAFGSMQESLKVKVKFDVIPCEKDGEYTTCHGPDESIPLNVEIPLTEKCENWVEACGFWGNNKTIKGQTFSVNLTIRKGNLEGKPLYLLEVSSGPVGQMKPEVWATIEVNLKKGIQLTDAISFSTPMLFVDTSKKNGFKALVEILPPN